MDDLTTGGSDLGSTTSSDLSSAVQSITTEAPKLTGLDKLRAQKEHVEKTGEIPPKDGARDATGKFVPKTPAATTAPAVAKPVVAAPGAVAPVKPAVTPPADPNAPVLPYTPNFKYKAQDKEFDIPERFRALMVDKESEEEVKKVFGQAASYEAEKTNSATLKKNLGEVGGVVNKYQTGIQQLRNLVQKNDLDGFFKGINIPQEKVFQWVLDKVNYNQLPPEQRAQVDHQRNLERQAAMAQEQVGQVSQRELAMATTMKTMQLDIAFGKTDVKSMSDSFDARAGRPGAFKDAIIEHGKAVWALSGQTVDLTPEQAVEDFVKKYGSPSSFVAPNPAAGAAIPAATTEASAPAAAPSANAAPPVKVIPNVAGRGAASPIKTKPRNLDDLKRLRDEAVKADNASRSPSQGYLAG